MLDRNNDDGESKKGKFRCDVGMVANVRSNPPVQLLYLPIYRNEIYPYAGERVNNACQEEVRQDITLRLLGLCYVS